MNKPETIPMNWTKYNKAGECGCVLCGKRLPARAINDKGLYVHIGQGGSSIMRADLPIVEGAGGGDCAVLSDGTIDTGDMGWFQIGPDCAKKIGREYVKELEAVG